MKSYPPKVAFWKTIFWPLGGGCCTAKFLRALENYKVLLAHSHRGQGPPYNFFQRGSKIGLKCSKGALITSELGSVAQRNFGT